MRSRVWELWWSSQSCPKRCSELFLANLSLTQGKGMSLSKHWNHSWEVHPRWESRDLLPLEVQLDQPLDTICCKRMEMWLTTEVKCQMEHSKTDFSIMTTNLLEDAVSVERSCNQLICTKNEWLRSRRFNTVLSTLPSTVRECYRCLDFHFKDQQAWDHRKLQALNQGVDLLGTLWPLLVAPRTQVTIGTRRN